MDDYQNIEFLPNEIIVNKIIPQLSLYDLLTLCQTNDRFRSLCGDQYIWQTKFKQAFPTVDPSPVFDWKKKYIEAVTKQIPAILNGDLVKYTTLDLSKNQLGLGFVLEDLSTILTGKDYSLVFLKGLIPVYITDTHEYSHLIFKDLLRDIDKLLLIPNTHIYDIIDISVSERGKYTEATHDFEYLETINRKLIKSNLFSPEGHPPIYGIVNLFGSRRIFTILDLQNYHDFRRCDILDKGELEKVLRQLLNVNNDVGHVSKDEICQIIWKELQKIEHLVHN